MHVHVYCTCTIDVGQGGSFPFKATEAKSISFGLHLCKTQSLQIRIFCSGSLVVVCIKNDKYFGECTHLACNLVTNPREFSRLQGLNYHYMNSIMILRDAALV